MVLNRALALTLLFLGTLFSFAYVGASLREVVLIAKFCVPLMMSVTVRVIFSNVRRSSVFHDESILHNIVCKIREHVSLRAFLPGNLIVIQSVSLRGAIVPL